MAKLLLFNKPYAVLTQFSAQDERKTLADYIKTKQVYPAGRLDYDSEGLLLLTDNGQLQHHISHPKKKMKKTYWVQVEGKIEKPAILKLQQGVELKDGLTKPATAKPIAEPKVWPRNPPIRKRENIPTSWLELTISEGRNRQVRRMTAAVGYPTLRLIRVAIGPWHLEQLAPGESRQLEVHMPEATTKTSARTRDRSSQTKKPTTRATKKYKQHGKPKQRPGAK